MERESRFMKTALLTALNLPRVRPVPALGGLGRGPRSGPGWHPWAVARESSWLGLAVARASHSGALWTSPGLGAGRGPGPPRVSEAPWRYPCRLTPWPASKTGPGTPGTGPQKKYFPVGGGQGSPRGLSWQGFLKTSVAGVLLTIPMIY